MSASTVSRPASGLDTENAGRTLLAFAACALGALPLFQMFLDRSWIFEVWAAMLVVVAPAAILRLRWRPHAGQTWLGLAALVPWLTMRFAPEHAIGGVLPGRETWREVTVLFEDFNRTVTHRVAPIEATPDVVFTLCVVLGLMAALVDLLAVVGRHGALAGIPLLVIFTVSGAIPRQPVHWLLFAAAASGYLILLSLDAREQVRAWGRLMPRPGETRATPGSAVSGQRIALIAILAAVLLPLIAPSDRTNLLADAFHNKGGGGGGGGFGGGGSSINPFVALKGQLDRPEPVDLVTVTLDPPATAQAFYLRTNVLTKVSERGWSEDSHGPGQALSATSFEVAPDNDLLSRTLNFTASFEVSGLRGDAAIFGRPIAVSGLRDSTEWSPQDELLVNSDVGDGDTYQETVAQPNPTVAELRGASEAVGSELAPWLAVPAATPDLVRSLVNRITKADPSPYNRARAISDYFTDPKNGFSYSLATEAGDSGSDLVDFLRNKTGYCQQFAASMGIMLRVAGVPARVVLGYTHGQPRSGSFTVTSNDAHAWVEAYFSGVGWIPFDPTPNAGVFGGSKTSLPWAPPPKRAAPGGNAGAGTGAPTTGPRRPDLPTAQGGPVDAPGADSRPNLMPWVLLALLVGALLALVPAAVRWLRRQRRLQAARRGDPDPLWDELSDTATDLGYVWSPARTPRQVLDWLGPQSGDERESLRSLATAVELARYAPHRETTPGAPAGLLDELRAVESQLRAQRRWGVRIRARLLPDSLDWRWPKMARRR